MSVPDVTWEINFSGSTWTDVTAFVEANPGWNCERGRDHELGRPTVGTANPVLRDDGRFDPTNTISPHYPHVLPYRPIRATLASNGTALFTGYIEKWGQGWNKHGRYATAPLTCVDALGPLATVDFDPDYDALILADGPYAYYRMGEAADDDDTTLFDSHTSDPAKQLNGYISSEVVREQPGAISGDDNTSMRFGVTSGAYGTLRKLLPRTGEAWVYLAAVPASVSVIVAGHRTQNGILLFRVGVLNSGGLAYPYVGNDRNVSGGAPSTLTSPTPISTNAWHHLAWRYTSTAGSYTVELYVDGTLAATHTETHSAAVALGQVPTFPAMIGTDEVVSGVAARQFPGYLDEVAFYEYDRLTPERIAEHHTVGITTRTYPQQTDSDRIAAVLDTAGWPSGQRDLDTGAVLVSASGPLGRTAVLEHLLLVAETGLGVLFADGQGRVVFQNILARASHSPAVTFGEDVPAGEVPYEGDIAFELAVDEVINDWSVVRTVGGEAAGTARAVDATSASAPPVGYFRRSAERTLPYALASDAEGVADLLLARYKDPHRRCPRLTVALAGRAQAFTDLVLAVEIGTPVRVMRRTPGGVTSQLDCWVEAVRHTVGLNKHDVQFLLSPA